MTHNFERLPSFAEAPGVLAQQEGSIGGVVPCGSPTPSYIAKKYPELLGQGLEIWETQQE